MSDKTTKIQSRLAQLGIVIPQAITPVANYVTTVQSGQHVFISGQLPFDEKGKLFAVGKVNTEVDATKAKKAAELCAINILGHAQATLGTLNTFKRIVKITAFVATTPSFTDISQIANGASDFFLQILGEAGRHARSAIGVTALPMDATVEVEAILEIQKEDNS
ncbi:MAG: Endoribonuclease [Candidatus Tokpelaia sp. JSC085]|nr:MAG: Endoribonuclease [Candidatus Tokpelaia sp. JSC085]